MLSLLSLVAPFVFWRDLFRGSVVMVPIAEALAFGGLPHRWLISRRFETVAFAQFSWFAFVVSSLLFGFMHQR